MVSAIRLVMLLLVAVLAAASVSFIFLPYETFTELIFRGYGQPEKLARFRQTLLTPARFALLRYASLPLTVLSVAIVVVAWRRVPFFATATQAGLARTASAIRGLWRRTSQTERLAVGLLFAAVLTSRFYFLFRLPLHVDERFTYLYFVSKGWAVSAAYYPNPNNHILFSLLCNISDAFLASPLLVLRLPSLLFGMAALAGFWLSARYCFSFGVAIFATALLAFTPVVFGYGIQGRGYSLLLGWTIAACFGLVKIVSLPVRQAGRQNAKPLYATLFVASSILGFYTVPVFLYPFAGMCVYAVLCFSWKRKYLPLANFLFLAALVAVGVFVLYLPVFVFNGWHSVSGNAWVAPLPWLDFKKNIAPNLAACSRTLWHDSPFSWCITLAFSLIAMFVVLSRKSPSIEKHWLALYLCCLWVVVPVVLVQKILLYGRVLVYVFPLQWLAFALLARRFGPHQMRGFQLFKRYYFVIAFIMVLGYAGFCLTDFRQLSSPQGRGIYNSLDGVSNWLYEHRADRIFVQYYEYGLCIRFAYETNARAIELDVGADRFLARKKYNFVVVHQSNRFPGGLPAADYRLVYDDGQAQVFELKK